MRTTFEAGDGLLDRESCVAICAHDAADECKNFQVQRNIAGGCAYAGFTALGHKCGEGATQQSFRDNVAHSVKGFKAGDGLIVTTNRTDPTSSECFEASNFVGYKNYYNGIASFTAATKRIISNSIILDNAMGMCVNSVPSGSEYDEHISQIEDNYLFGASISPDCPQEKNGGFCFKKDKFGYTVGVGARGGKSQFILTASPRPHMKIKADATWGGRNRLLRNKFKDYAGLTETGNKNALFGLNFAASDHIPLTEFEDNEFINIEGDAFGYFFDPPTGWANVKDCGNFPCTAPWNVLLTFKGSKFSGRSPSFAKSEF